MAKASQETNNTVYVGNVEVWMDEAYLFQAFGDSGPVTNVKLVRERRLHGQGSKQGFGFVEFASHDDAAKLIQHCDVQGPWIAKDGHRFRVSWAMYGVNGDRKQADDVAMYVGNLDVSVRETDLLKFFHEKYKSVVSAKVIVDPRNSVSKGYSFVYFRDPEEAELVLKEMDGVYLSGKAVRIRPALKQTFKHFGDDKRNDGMHQSWVPGALPPPPPPTPAYSTWHAQKDDAYTQNVPCAPQAPCCQPAITNMTTAQAQVQAWQLVGGAQEVQAEAGKSEGCSYLGLEHFQVLLQHPLFVQAFEQKLLAASEDAGSASEGMQIAAKLSPFLHDRPDTFGKRSSTADANEEFLTLLDPGLGF